MGLSFVSRLEGMLSDLNISKDTMVAWVRNETCLTYIYREKIRTHKHTYNTGAAGVGEGLGSPSRLLRPRAHPRYVGIYGRPRRAVCSPPPPPNTSRTHQHHPCQHTNWAIHPNIHTHNTIRVNIHTIPSLCKVSGPPTWGAGPGATPRTCSCPSRWRRPSRPSSAGTLCAVLRVSGDVSCHVVWCAGTLHSFSCRVALLCGVRYFVSCDDRFPWSYTSLINLPV